MKLAEAEMVMEYCADIRRKRRMIERRRAELSDEISSLRGMGFDGMPRVANQGIVRRQWPVEWKNWGFQKSCEAWTEKKHLCGQTRPLFWRNCGPSTASTAKSLQNGTFMALPGAGEADFVVSALQRSQPETETE